VGEFILSSPIPGPKFGRENSTARCFKGRRRGERLVALYVHPALSPADLWQQLSETDLPRLWLPKRENLYPVEELPLLGTGKLDLRAVKTRAQALAAVNA